MQIKRDNYLKELIDRKHNGLIKVVTGVRRCGKSYLLLTLFHNHLISEGILPSHIIELALDDRRNKQYRNPDMLYDHIVSSIVDNEMHYVILDEVQLVEEFADVLNSLLHICNVDVYVTGSNSKFLSSDIITEFRGRGDEVHVYPLSFSEFYSAFGGDKIDAWNNYFTYGGLPLILTRTTPKQKVEYLTNLFKETYIKDLIERNHIRNDSDFEELIDILASSIGSLTNPQKLSDTFKSVKKSNISAVTVKQYINYLEDAFLIENAFRYDVKGKKYINTPSKFYFVDVGLRNARLNFRQQEENHIMENIIFNELKIRGFNVDVGVVVINEKTESGKYMRKVLEVDFIANQGNKKYYVQSAFNVGLSDKLEQERRSLVHIDDSFKKIIVVKDNIMLKRDEHGIVTMGILEFLLNSNSLDL